MGIVAQGADEFSTSARVLMVLAVGEHNAALVVDGGHPGKGTENWEVCLFCFVDVAMYHVLTGHDRIR